MNEFYIGIVLFGGLFAGWKLHEYLMFEQLDRLISEDMGTEMRINLHFEHGQYFAYDVDDGLFLTQSPSASTVFNYLVQTYPDRKFVFPTGTENV